MLEKAAPFVEGNNEHSTRPRRSASHGVERLRQKGIAPVDVAVGMIVVGGVVVLDGVSGQDETTNTARTQKFVRES